GRCEYSDRPGGQGAHRCARHGAVPGGLAVRKTCSALAARAALAFAQAGLCTSAGREGAGRRMNATATSSPELQLIDGKSADLDSVIEIMNSAFDERFGEAWTRSQCA